MAALVIEDLRKSFYDTTGLTDPERAVGRLELPGICFTLG